jgi:uncharacterized protein Yka (UPF0111/DUF47 family)
VKKRRAIFKELTHVIDVAVEANTLVLSMFRMGYNDKGLVEIMYKVQQLEKTADGISFKLSEEITSGAISPML